MSWLKYLIFIHFLGNIRKKLNNEELEYYIKLNKMYYWLLIIRVIVVKHNLKNGFNALPKALPLGTDYSSM